MACLCMYVCMYVIAMRTFVAKYCFDVLYTRGLGGAVDSREIVGPFLTIDSCEKSQSTLCRMSLGFLRVPHTGKFDRMG
jgi:hypothetical protein